MSNRMLPGLMSRWSRSCLSARSSAEAILVPMSSTASSVHAHVQFLDARVEAAPVGQFHHQILLQTFPFVEGVDVDDVGVVEPGARARLAVKTFKRRSDPAAVPFSSASPPPSVPAPCPSRDTPLPMPPDADDAAQLELPQQQRHHDRMPALAAGHGGQRREIAGNEHGRSRTSCTSPSRKGFIAHALKPI
jgi:hypothetical protein